MAALTSGQVIAGRIRLERLLGEGGMGSVWVAEHIALGTRVAVKFIDAGLLEKSPELRERFGREAAIAAKITSPHVVRTFDFGDLDDGTPYLVMELLAGESLYDRLAKERPLPQALAVEIIRQTAKALDDAHLHGVVHRDIKPGNIFLTQSGRDVFVKVLDFGIAKNVDATKNDSSTKTGMTLGTPAYMSPEQLMSSKGVDLQADLWALAVTAYEALFGLQPFRGETVPSLIVAIHGQSFDPPSSRSGSAIANLAALDGFFRRAFAKTPAERFATALDLSDGLAAAIDGKPMTPRETPTSRTAYGAPLDGAPGAARKGETAMFSDADGKPAASKLAPPATDPGAPLDAPTPKAAERTEYGAPSVVVETPTKASADPVPVIAPVPAATNRLESPPRAEDKRPVWIVPAALAGAAAVGVLVWLAVRNNSVPSDSGATQATGTATATATATATPSTSTRVASAPTRSASALASGEPSSAPEFDVPDGTTASDADGEVYATGFHVRVLDATQKSLTGAFAACKDMSMLPCTDFQWKRACAQEASLAVRDTWTSSELQAKAVIDGGKTCNDQSLGTFHAPGHNVVCCDPAVAATQSAGHLGKDAFMSRVGTARDYVAAMDAENIKKVVSLYDENVDFNGTSRPRDSLGSMGKAWFAAHPDQTYAYGVCTFQSGAGWNLACPAMIYRDAKLLRLDVRLGFTSDDHVRQVGEDGVRDLPD